MAPGTQNNAFYALQNFFGFLKETGRREENPVEKVQFKKHPVVTRPTKSVSQVSQKLGRLASHHQDIANFAMELAAADATLMEVFSIDEDTPVPPQVRVKNGRGDLRLITISPQAQKKLNEWGGKLPIGIRAFQRALEKVNLSPKLLGEPSRSSLAVELHPRVEQTLQSSLVGGNFSDATSKAFFEVRQLLRHLGDPDHDGPIDGAFIEELDLDPYFISKRDAKHFKMLLTSSIALFSEEESRGRLLRDDTTVGRESVALGDMLVRLLELFLDIRSRHASELDKARPVEGVTEIQLKQLRPFEFQNWVVRRFHGKLAPTLTSDMGIDGYAQYGEPIQVKQSERVTRDEIDRFETAVERTGHPKGFIVAFSFSDNAYLEADRARETGKVDIRLVTVKELLEAVPR